MGEHLERLSGKHSTLLGFSISETGNALLSVSGDDQSGIVEVGHALVERGYTLYGTQGTAELLQQNGISISRVNKVREGRPHVVDMLKNGEIEFNRECSAQEKKA